MTIYAPTSPVVSAPYATADGSLASFDLSWTAEAAPDGGEAAYTFVEYRIFDNGAQVDVSATQSYTWAPQIGVTVGPVTVTAAYTDGVDYFESAPLAGFGSLTGPTPGFERGSFSTSSPYSGATVAEQKIQTTSLHAWLIARLQSSVVTNFGGWLAIETAVGVRVELQEYAYGDAGGTPIGSPVSADLGPIAGIMTAAPDTPPILVQLTSAMTNPDRAYRVTLYTYYVEDPENDAMTSLWAGVPAGFPLETAPTPYGNTTATVITLADAPVAAAQDVTDTSATIALTGSYTHTAIYAEDPTDQGYAGPGTPIAEDDSASVTLTGLTLGTEHTVYAIGTLANGNTTDPTAVTFTTEEAPMAFTPPTDWADDFVTEVVDRVQGRGNRAGDLRAVGGLTATEVDSGLARADWERRWREATEGDEAAADADGYMPPEGFYDPTFAAPI